MDRLRVLIVAHGHPALSIGGAEHAAYALFRRLQGEDAIEPIFLAAAELAADDTAPPRIEPVVGRPNEYLLYAAGFDGFMLAHAPAAAEVLYCFLAALDPAVVHFHHYLNFGVEMFQAARRARRDLRILVTLHEYRAICHHHGTMVTTRGALCEAANDDGCAHCFPEFAPAEFARRRARVRHHFDLVDRFVAPSRFLRQRYVAWGIAPRRIQVIANVIEDGPAEVAARPNPDDTVIFGYFGQIHPFKGLDCLLSAFDCLRDDPAIRLVVHGAHLEQNHPSYIALIKALLDRNEDRVRFAGPYRHEYLDSLMGAVDWVVVPSLWWENAPTVIEEALARRKPILCSGIGGMKEKVRDGKDGLHFPPGDPASLARLMRKVAADPSIAQSLRRSIRAPTGSATALASHLEAYRSVR